MFEGILRYFTLNSMEGKEPGTNGKINIVPGFETYLGNFRVIKRMLNEMGVDYTFLSDPEEVLDTPADGAVPHVRRRHDAGRSQGRAQRHQHLPAPAAGSSTRPRSSSRAPGTTKSPSCTSRWAWSGPTSS